MPCAGAQISVRSAIPPLATETDYQYFINSLDTSQAKNVGLLLARSHNANGIHHSPITPVDSQTNKQPAKVILRDYVAILRRISIEF